MRGMFPISEYYQPIPSLLQLSALANMTHGSPRADIALRHSSLALTHSSLCISSECLPNSRIPQHRAGRSSLALRPRLPFARRFYSKSHPSLSRNISFSFSPSSSISDTRDDSCPLSASRVSVIILLVSLLLTNFLQRVF